MSREVLHLNTSAPVSGYMTRVSNQILLTSQEQVPTSGFFTGPKITLTCSHCLLLTLDFTWGNVHVFLKALIHTIVSLSTFTRWIRAGGEVDSLVRGYHQNKCAQLVHITCNACKNIMCVPLMIWHCNASWVYWVLNRQFRLQWKLW